MAREYDVLVASGRASLWVRGVKANTHDAARRYALGRASIDYPNLVWRVVRVATSSRGNA